jgi:hypothetical protein
VVAAEWATEVTHLPGMLLVQVLASTRLSLSSPQAVDTNHTRGLLCVQGRMPPCKH